MHPSFCATAQSGSHQCFRGFSIAASVGGTARSNSAKVVVPPQAFIQLLYGESLQQGRIAKLAIASTVRNRLSRRGFEDNYSFNALIFADGQYDSVGRPLFAQAGLRTTRAVNLLDYDRNVAIAGALFAGTQPDITRGCVSFFSPTKDQMEDVLACQKSKSEICDIANVPWGWGKSVNWQIVILEGVERNTNRGDLKRFGQPAFLFLRPRSSADPPVDKVSLSTSERSPIVTPAH